MKASIFASSLEIISARLATVAEGQQPEEERRRPDDSQNPSPLFSLLWVDDPPPQPDAGAVAEMGSPGWGSPDPQSARLLYDKGRRLLRQIQELTEPPGGSEPTCGLLECLLREGSPTEPKGARLRHLLLADEIAGPQGAGFGVLTPPWETGSLPTPSSWAPGRAMAESEREPRGGRDSILSKAMLAAGIPTIDRGASAPTQAFRKVAASGRVTFNLSAAAQGPTWKRRAPCSSRTPDVASTSSSFHSRLPFGHGRRPSASLPVANNNSAVASPCSSQRFLRHPLLDHRTLYSMTAKEEELTGGASDAMLEAQDGGCSDLLSDTQDGGCSDLLSDTQDGGCSDLLSDTQDGGCSDLLSDTQDGSMMAGTQDGGCSDLLSDTQDGEPVDIVKGAQDGGHAEMMVDTRDGSRSNLLSDTQDGGPVDMMADPPEGEPVDMMTECQDGGSSDLRADSQDGGSCDAFCASSPHLSEDFGQEAFYTPERSPSDVEGDIDPEAQMARLGEDEEEEEPGGSGVLLGLGALNTVSGRPAQLASRSIKDEGSSLASGSSQSGGGSEGRAGGSTKEGADDVYTEIHQDMFSKAFLFNKFMKQGRFQRKPSNQSGK
ncbi:uncharacterized protein LOC122542353 [Chiloscyllium plagiosum]|uniref:uncharacterized protein LOC122542353 n=1 Tax=Chiloscyllium plagiosum TaxID=36176 RepID=UPI001CB7C8D3|nr:uncharacterized protein LOC122542353 [Chiloscyllium plagiosum]